MNCAHHHIDGQTARSDCNGIDVSVRRGRTAGNEKHPFDARVECTVGTQGPLGVHEVDDPERREDGAL